MSSEEKVKELEERLHKVEEENEGLRKVCDSIAERLNNEAADTQKKLTRITGLMKKQILKEVLESLKEND